METQVLCLAFIVVATVITLAIRHFNRKVPLALAGNDTRYQTLKAQSQEHEAAWRLQRLVERDGAGTWPPKCTYDAWPAALRPYQDIYFEMVPDFPTADASLDDEANTKRRTAFRAKMRKLFDERINVADVRSILEAVEDGNNSRLPRDKYNAFYCAVAVCRHMYRWATLPVVKVAQDEKVVDFPTQLDIPWEFLQRSFGVTAESGNNTANVLHNFDSTGARIFKINVGMRELITNSEEAFFRMFYDLEVFAFPMYYEIVQAILTFERGDRKACAEALANVNVRLRYLLQVFYSQLTEARVSKEVWLSYVQGFQGWGVGRMVGNEHIKYDGLSGNHVLAFQALDAFLGLDHYLTAENLVRYIPVNQRNLCIAFKQFCFRDRLEADGDEDIRREFTEIVNRLKVFRAAHRTRVMPYLQQPAPERHTMTAGKSVLTGSAKEALKSLDEMLEKRFNETI